MAKEYFHITKKAALPWSKYPCLKVGDVVETGEVNPFFNYFLTANRPVEIIKYPDGTTQQLSEMEFLTALSRNSLSINLSVAEIARRGQDLAMHFCKYTRELIWERIRAESYPEKPSRQKCLWLAEGEENLQYWLSQLGRPEDIHVFRLEIDGVTHDASDEHLMNDHVTYDQAIIMAKSYWNGDISNVVAKEVLFEGRAKVVGQFI